MQKLKLNFFFKTGLFFLFPFMMSAQHLKVFSDSTNHKGLKDTAGKIIVPAKYEDIHDEYEGVYKIMSNNKWGFLDSQGRVVIDPQFDVLDNFSNGYALVGLGDKCGYIDSKGKIVVSPIYEYGREFYNDRVPVVKNDKWGYIDSKGKEITAFKYDFAEEFYTETAIVCIHQNDGKPKSYAGNYGLVDLNGKEVVKPVFQYMDYCDGDEGLIYVANIGGHIEEKEIFNMVNVILTGGKWQLINKNGALLSEQKFDAVFPVCKDPSSAPAIRKDSLGNWNFILGSYSKDPDPMPRKITESSHLYEMAASGVMDGIYFPIKKTGIKVVYNNKFGFIDYKGNVLIKPDYDLIDDFHENYTSAVKNGKYGLINSKGDELSLFKYDEVLHFQKNRARVKQAGKFGFIDSLGNEVVGVKYDSTDGYFAGDRIKVKLAGKYGFVKADGKELCPLIYSELRDFTEGRALMAEKRNNKLKYGFLNETGTVAVKPVYDSAEDFSEGLAVVSLNGKYGYIDKAGKLVIPLKYEWAGAFSDSGMAQVRINGRIQYINKPAKKN